jgi:O-antigen chain-terminating methyltransferase
VTDGTDPDGALRPIIESLESLGGEVRDLRERLEDAQRMLLDNNHRLMLAENRQAADRTELLIQRSRVDDMAQARHVSDDVAGATRSNRGAQGDRDRFADLYAALETRFRGSPGDVRRRQEAYVPDVLALRDRSRPFFDIGPGRGEWLSLLRDHGVSAYGVDTNPTFVEQGRTAGLDIRLGDAGDHLAECDESSLCGVSAFHVVEHIDFDTLVAMLDRALRALAPGGLLLLETPNPLNVTVGAAAFWIDPTHRRPPDMLRFLVESRGFVNAAVRFVNHPPHPDVELPDRPDPVLATLRQISDVFFAGTDYAVLARKAMPVG